MSTSDKHDEDRDRETLIAMEKATVAAFKSKSEAEFTRHFSPAYIGVANDGFKRGADEVAGMRKLDLRELVVEGAKATFPAVGVGIVTYAMKVEGSMGSDPVSGTIYTSTVYVRASGRWSAVLHTESMAPAA